MRLPWKHSILFYPAKQKSKIFLTFNYVMLLLSIRRCNGVRERIQSANRSLKRGASDNNYVTRVYLIASVRICIWTRHRVYRVWIPICCQAIASLCHCNVRHFLSVVNDACDHWAWSWHISDSKDYNCNL